MHITSIQLKNFRCFSSLTLDLDTPIIFVMGPNGIGKTSILEALHYACYLKSFKTHIPKDLIKIEQPGFSIQLSIRNSDLQDDISIGFTGAQRSVKINQKKADSYKELLQLYKVITLTEDDLMLVKGSPAIRRTFIDQLLLLLDASHLESIRKYKVIIDNRNALLASGSQNLEQYYLWTNQLLAISRQIQQRRIKLLADIEQHINLLAQSVFGAPELFKLQYKYAIPYNILDITDYEQLINTYPRVLNHEYKFKRSLFGAHLDDFHIVFQDKLARLFASRGQQKCMVFLLKLAQLQCIHNQQTDAVFLIDDFMVDLDKEKMAALIPLITQLARQVIITSPIEQTILKEILCAHQPDTRIISLPAHPEPVPSRSSG